MAVRRNGEPQTCPTPDQVERAEQQEKAVRMKRDGKTFPEIAEELGCAVSTAHKLFHQGIKRWAPLGSEMELQVIRVQLEEQYRQVVEDLAHTGDLKTKIGLYRVALENIEKRRKLFGGADINIKITMRDQFDEEFERLEQAFKADQDIRNQARARVRRRGPS
jgi:uncharacterized protein YerC